MLFSRFKKMNRLLLVLFPFLVGCQLFDQPEIAPSYIHIENFNFIITNSSQGTNSEKITDAWVYVNNNLEGVYELPATIPLHYKGINDLTIYPGIKRNGISADRKKYPFYTPYPINLDLIADSIIEIYPTTEYEDQLFMWIEDFEDPQHKFNSTANSFVDLTVIDAPTNEVFEGNTAAIDLDSSQLYCEIRTDELEFNSFPKNLSIPAYIELDYANNFPFEIGILHKDASISFYLKEPLITFVPTTETDSSLIWNKTYLYISDATNFHTNATEFDLYLSVSNPNQINDIKIRLDNFKVIYR